MGNKKTTKFSLKARAQDQIISNVHTIIVDAYAEGNYGMLEIKTSNAEWVAHRLELEGFVSSAVKGIVKVLID